MLKYDTNGEFFVHCHDLNTMSNFNENYIVSHAIFNRFELLVELYEHL